MSSLSLTDPSHIAFIFLGVFLGAVLKGATGVGLPIIAIPTIAAIYDIRIAVVLLVIPNFFTNAWQVVQYKEHDLPNSFARNFALAGILGAGIGTLLLAYLPLVLLNILIVVVVFSYVATRLARPNFQLAMNLMRKWELMAGTSAGVLQGAVGLSSPITLTFLNAGRLPRFTFVYTASLFFAGLSVIQLPLQLALGLMTWKLALLSTLTVVPIVIGLPLGDLIGRKLNTVVFDRIILLLLTIIASKMLWEVVLSV